MDYCNAFPLDRIVLGSDQGDNQFPVEIRSPVCVRVHKLLPHRRWCRWMVWSCGVRKSAVDAGGMCFNWPTPYESAIECREEARGGREK